MYSASDPIKLRDLYVKSRAVQKPNINECTCHDDGMTAFLIPLVTYEKRILPVVIILAHRQFFRRLIILASLEIATV